MSNIQLGATPTGPAMLVPEADLSDSLPKSFWSIVGRAYWRSIQTRVATTWALFLIFLTVFVPFIANDAPYTAVIDGQRVYPLFRNLTRVDLIWLIWGIALPLFFFISWRVGKRLLELEQIRAIRFNWMLLIGAVALAATIAVAVRKSDYLDDKDYHALARAGAIKDAVYAPLRWGYAEQEHNVFAPRDSVHLLGTDWTGRDVLSRLLWGARIVLEIGLVSEIISLVIGVIYGALMGYFSGNVDILGMRFVEVVEAIPQLFLLIIFVAIFGRQLFMLMVLIGITNWTGIARFVRAEFLRMRRMDFVSAAQAMGLPLRNILFRHMLPNGLTPVIVTFTFGVAANIVSESILSFLGIGVEPPTASWGSMLEQAGDPGVIFRWWLAMPPGIMIFLTVFAYNVMGEALRDAIDPKTNKVE